MKLASHSDAPLRQGMAPAGRAASPPAAASAHERARPTGSRAGAKGFGLALLALAFGSSVRSDEFRGLWVDAWGPGFLNASQVTQLIADCRAYNFNAIVVQMRRRGDAFYNLTFNDPKTTAIASGFDALQDLLNKAHDTSGGQPRIEVHCWVATYKIWSDETVPPSQPGHVYNLHPEYLTQDQAGNRFTSEGYCLDPGHPDAALWNYQMATNIVRRYDVDGFHWDYIRYPESDSGYNPTAIARYNAEFGLTGQPAANDAQFSNWRRRQVTDFLRWSSADLLAHKPNLVISCAVFGSRSDAYNARFQDWAAWNSEGILDICMPMGYTANNDGIFVPRVDDAYNHQGVRRVYHGQGAYLNPKENTVWQLDYIRNKPLLGTMLYSYRTPNSGTVNQPVTFAFIRDQHQPTWANVPVIPWKAAPTMAILRGTVTRQSDGQAVYNAIVTINTSPGRNQKTEPHGKFAFFETPPGNYTVTASAPGLVPVTTNVTLTAGTNREVALVLPPDTSPPVLADVIVESRDAAGDLTPNPPYADSGFSNSTLKSSAAGLNGSGSRYAVAGTPSFTLQPGLPVAGGHYDVYVTHGNASSVSDDLIAAVSQSGGSGLPATTTVLQQSGANTWEYLGRLKLNDGVTRPAITFTYAGGTLDANGNGRMYSDSVKFVYFAPPAITNQPTDAAVNQGANATFTVGATGGAPLSYQWRFEGVDLPGATASSFTRSNAQPAHAGHYAVVITNVAGAVTSNPALLAVSPPQPARFTSVSRLPDGRVRLLWTGESGGSCFVLAATNLSFSNSVLLGPVSGVNGVFEYVDDAVEAPQRFYRTQQ